MSLRASLESAPIMDRSGYEYVIHPLTDGVPRVDPELLREWVEWASTQPMLHEATVLLAPEAMALPLAAALSLATAIPYVVGRKRAYGLDGEMLAYCETGYSGACIHINDVGPADEVVIVDDMISTAGTIAALLETLGLIGARVRGVLAPLEKGDGAARLRERTPVPIECMHRIDVMEGRVVVS